MRCRPTVREVMPLPRAFLLPALATGALVAPAAASAATYDIVHVCGTNLCRVNSDGTGARQITTDGSDSASYGTPSFDATGRRLAFRHGSDVFVGDANAANRVEISAGNINRHISLSPDATRVGVAQERYGYQMWMKLFRADGTGAPWGDNESGVSSGWLGDRIFTNESNGPRESLCLWKDQTLGCERWVAADPLRSIYLGDGSPDGRYVVAEASGAAGSDVALYDAANGGGHLRDLTTSGTGRDPEFSPDGREVVFDSGPPGASRIAVMAAGGAPGSERVLVAGSSPTAGAVRAATTPDPGTLPAILRSAPVVPSRVTRAGGIRLTLRLNLVEKLVFADMAIDRQVGKGWRRVAKRLTRICRTSPCRITIKTVNKRRLAVGRHRIRLHVWDVERDVRRTFYVRVTS